MPKVLLVLDSVLVMTAFTAPSMASGESDMFSPQVIANRHYMANRHLRVVKFPLKRMSAATAASKLSAMLKHKAGIKIVFDEPTNTVLVQASEEILRRASEILDGLDAAVK